MSEASSTAAAPREPKLLDRVQEAARVRHLSYRTEKTYVHWIRRYILFHGKRHPGEMGEVEINATIGAYRESFVKPSALKPYRQGFEVICTRAHLR